MPPNSTIILKKCPFCGWVFLAEKGDRAHPYCSIEKPIESNVKGDLITKLYDCRNPKCSRRITAYYYQAKPVLKLG